MPKAKKPTKRTKKPATKRTAVKAKKPRDLHAETAAKMCGIPFGQVKETHRNFAKKLNYLHQYGGAVFSFPFIATPPTANAVIPAWRTKDGRVILVSTMSDAHLANAMAMLYRKLGPLMAEAAKRAQESREVHSGDKGESGDVSDFPHDVDFGDLF
jgi:crotonobetainyl-CoA:carnitine CoA-transferase CaiB-like acyl-CoA transferase